MLFLLLIIQLNHEYDHKTGLNILEFSRIKFRSIRYNSYLGLRLDHHI